MYLNYTQVRVYMSSFIHSNISVECSEAASDIGGQRKQQDNGLCMVCADVNGQKLYVAAVFDGHGNARGEMFSQGCRDTLSAAISRPAFVTDFYNAPETTGRALFAEMSAACFAMNRARLDKLGVSYRVDDGLIYTEHMTYLNGGTTCTLVVVTETGWIHTFNVGDSDAWFVTRWTSQLLTGNHSPENESEYERVHSQWPDTKFEYQYHVACGRSRRSDGSHIFPKRDGFQGYFCKNMNGDMATSIQVGSSFLAMTRALGDEPLRRGGLIAVPSYRCVQATAPGVIRLATDGFWDNIRNADILSRTATAVARHGYDAHALNMSWLKDVHAMAKQNFGSSRDNMWAYTMTVAPK